MDRGFRLAFSGTGSLGGNSLAVRLPASVVAALELEEGAGPGLFEVSRDRTREEAPAKLRGMRRELPPGSASIVTRRMSVRTFFDSNVLVYAVSCDDKRADRAEALLSEGGVVSVRKLCAPPVPVTLQTHETALRIVGQYGYGICDALAGGCTMLLREDMQEGQVIYGTLTIRNPFLM